MREIKFRCWIEHNKVMYYPGQVSINSAISDSLLFRVGYHNGFDMADWEKSIPFMEYTGWRDKNGKEMYEGDIVKTNYYTGTPGHFKRIVGKIVYHFPAFVVEGINQYEGMRKALHGLSEVIGNIYETPELLVNAEKQ
jgi:uncharacterized phage protein (TIGR01671 family)